MKTQLLRVSLAAVVAAAALCAQNSGSLTANVPFDFVVSGKTLGAGQITVAQAPISGAVIIKSVDHREGMVMLTNALSSPNAREQPARLVFHRYGDTYFLSEVWGDGRDGRQLPQSSRERELAARQAAPKSTIQVALRSK